LSQNHYARAGIMVPRSSDRGAYCVLSGGAVCACARVSTVRGAGAAGSYAGWWRWRNISRTFRVVRMARKPVIRAPTVSAVNSRS